MQITRKDISPTSVKLTVSLDAAELEPMKNHVLAKHFSQAKVPGFRVGKAPAQILERSVDQQSLTQEFLDHAINEYYLRALQEEDLRPVGKPKAELKKFVPYTLMEFDITQEVVGAIKLPDYKKIKLARPKVSVTAKDVDEVLKSLQLRGADRKQVDRAAKNGDETVIDFAGKDAKGEAVAGANGKDYPLTLGSGSFIPGFEENLVGLKAGETKTFKVTFPADYTVEALQKKPVTFEVSVKKVNEISPPKLDDEFAKGVGPFKSLAELKTDIKKQLEVEKKRQADNQYQGELIKKIADKSTMEIPQALIDEQVDRIEEEERRNLMYRGQTWDEHLKEEGVTAEEHRQRHMPEAAERVKAGLVLSEISIKEGLTVEPKEIDARIAELKTQYQDDSMRAELDKPENRQEIGARLLTDKTIDKLVGYASK